MIDEISHGDTQETDSCIYRFDFLKICRAERLIRSASRVGSVNVIRLVRVVKSP